MVTSADTYQTLAAISEGLYKEKGSKFIARAMPAANTEEVKQHLEQLRRQFHDARHHCYAYRIGELPGEIKYQDDGEPSGTAGKPILGQIQAFGLTNVLIVVIRYFGGVKLGTGGLVQAYKTAARDAIAGGHIITLHWTFHLNVSFDYTSMNEVMKLVKDENLRILAQESGNRQSMLLEIRKGIKESMLKKFSSVETLEWTVI